MKYPLPDPVTSPLTFSATNTFGCVPSTIRMNSKNKSSVLCFLSEYKETSPHPLSFFPDRENDEHGGEPSRTSIWSVPIASKMSCGCSSRMSLVSRWTSSWFSLYVVCASGMNSEANKGLKPAISKPRQDPPQPENNETVLNPFVPLMFCISTIEGTTYAGLFTSVFHSTQIHT